MRNTCGIVMLAMIAGGCATSPLATTDSPPTPRTDAGRTVVARLNEKVDAVEFDDIDLWNIVQFFRDITGSSIYVDWQAMQRIGINRASTVHLSSTDMTVHAALLACLRSIRGGQQLTYAVAGGVVIIAPPDDALALAERILTPLKVPDTPRNRKATQRLNEVIRELNFEDIELGDIIQFMRDVSGMSIYVDWDGLHAVGVSRNTPVMVRAVNVSLRTGLALILNSGLSAPEQALDWGVADGVIVIAPPEDVRALAARISKPLKIPDAPQNRKAVQRLGEVIRELPFDSIELEDVIQFMRDVSGLNIHVDWDSLRAVGVSRHTRITVKAQNMSLRTGLALILHSTSPVAAHALDWDVANGTVVIAERRSLPAAVESVRHPPSDD